MCCLCCLLQKQWLLVFAHSPGKRAWSPSAGKTMQKRPFRPFLLALFLRLTLYLISLFCVNYSPASFPPFSPIFSTSIFLSLQMFPTSLPCPPCSFPFSTNVSLLFRYYLFRTSAKVAYVFYDCFFRIYYQYQSVELITAANCPTIWCYSFYTRC